MENLADSQVEKSGHPPAILGVRMPGCPLTLYTAICNIFHVMTDAEDADPVRITRVHWH